MASNISKVSIREENGWIRVKRFQELFKIVLLGDSGVGKTSLGYQYAEEKVLLKPQLTVGFDYWTKELEIEGETVKVSQKLKVYNPLLKQFIRSVNKIFNLQKSFYFDNHFCSLKYGIQQELKSTGSQ